MSGVSTRDIRPLTFVVVMGPRRQPGLPFRVGGRTALAKTGEAFSLAVGSHTFRLEEAGVVYQAMFECRRGHTASDPFAVDFDQSMALTAVIGALRANVVSVPTVQTVRPKRSSVLTVREGAVPAAETVVYIHGIGNKPAASVLKCQWDTALFGMPLGDRTRMAYWVNRDHYPVPTEATCATPDSIAVVDDDATARITAAFIADLDADDRLRRQDAVLRRELLALSTDRERRQWLRQIATRMQEAAVIPEAQINQEIQRLRDSRAKLDTAALESRPKAKQVDPYTVASEKRAIDDSLHRYTARVLPLPPLYRRLITRQISRVFLRDVHDFLFNENRRQAMVQSLADRLQPGGGPFVIVAHSLGSLIAWELLRTQQREDCPVRLLVTIGSPLGMLEIQDILAQWDGRPLRVPECVDRWVNVADRLDPVALDAALSGEFAANARGVAVADTYDWGLNEDSPRHPQSATGYLHSPLVQEAMRGPLGNAFAQATGRFVVSRDLTDDMEDAHAQKPHRTLIQLADGSASGGRLRDLKESQKQLVGHIRAMVRRRPNGDADPHIDEMRRFVAADLTRAEIEELRTLFADLNIDGVWRNARKRALINVSTDTVQARTANLSYRATGRDIGWAVLDTGIAGGHPHFELHKNVRMQWDCTLPGSVIAIDPKHPQFEGLDRNGHGTHVAGIIAGEWRPKKRRDAGEIFTGIAPEAGLYGFKVLDDDGNGHDSFIIKALDKIAEINESASRLVIHGVNLSLGGNFDATVYGCGHTPLCEELRRLWRQGVLVCLAAGNEGYAVLQGAGGSMPANLDISIGDPANLDEAIAVGSVHKRNPHSYGVSYFSSRGPTADGRRKPDVVAPGELVMSAYHAYDGASEAVKDLYVEMSGTSMAAPHVSGMLAAFLSVRREFIGYPDRVKEILLRNATDLGRDAYAQGAGLPNLVRMLTAT